MTDTAEARGLVFRGLARTYEALAPWGYTLIRFSAGAVVVYSWLCETLRRFCSSRCEEHPGPAGISFARGLGVFPRGPRIGWRGDLTRPLALLFVIELAIVTYWHSGNGYFFTSPGGGWEFPLLLLLQYLGILLAGGGRHSVDRMLGREF